MCVPIFNQRKFCDEVSHPIYCYICYNYFISKHLYLLLHFKYTYLFIFQGGQDKRKTNSIE